MAASYPSSLPVKDAAGANLSTNPHSTLHDGMYDEIVAIATELGTLPKGTAASVKARLDALPFGVVGHSRKTASQTGIVTKTDITDLTVTFTAVAGRRYKATCQTETYATGVVESAANSNQGVLELLQGTTDLARCSFDSTSNGFLTHHVSYVSNASISGSKTWKIAMTRSSGEGDLNILATATIPSFLLVEDIGPL